MREQSEPPAGMRGIRSLLVPLDRSAIAERVFLSAVQWARLCEAHVHLLHVLDVAPPLPPAAHVVPDGLEAKLIAEGMTELERWMSLAPDVVFEPAQVVIGEPRRTILHVARDVDAELIVIGSHRYGGVDRILGTVAAHVVNHADRDVLVIHTRNRVSPTDR